MTTNAALSERAGRTDVETLREVTEALAPIQRLAGSEGEREAAEWLRDRLIRAGAGNARVEPEPYKDGFAPLIASLGAVSAASGLLAMTRPGRALGGIAAAAAGALIADDISNGPRVARGLFAEDKTTWNVVAEVGDLDAERTLVVMGHHDAARTGLIFDPTLQEAIGERFPGVIERFDTSVPQWWGMLAGPALIAAGAATGKRKLAALGTAFSAAGTFLVGDIARSDVVPGANDNLSGVAALVALAEKFADQPVEGLRVMLVSCGAEEVLQGGVYGFAKSHLREMDREKTWMLNLDTIGSPNLVLLEGEGCTVMEDYFDITFRDLIARVAGRDAIPMRRGMRSRASTDAVIPSRMGIPTATLTSLNRYKALSNYHQPTDVPENLEYATVACAADLSEAVARELADAG